MSSVDSTNNFNLKEVISRGDEEALVAWIRRGGGHANTQDEQGNSAVHYASFF